MGPAALNAVLLHDLAAPACRCLRLGPWPTGPVSSACCEKGGTSGAEPALSTGAHIGSPVFTLHGRPACIASSAAQCSLIVNYIASRFDHIDT